MRAVFLTVVVAVTALRFSQRNAKLLNKVADFEASTVAYQKSRSDLVDAIVADFQASTDAYQKSQSVWNAGNESDLSAELASAEAALEPRPDSHEFSEDKFLDEVYREARADKKAEPEAAAEETLQNEDRLASRIQATHSLFLHAREEAKASELLHDDVEGADEPKATEQDALSPMGSSDDVEGGDEPKAPSSGKRKTHVLSRIRGHLGARAHSVRVDLPAAPAQQDVCDPGITVCLPCDGADAADTRLIPRVLQSIAAQSCLPEKVILAASGISSDKAAELLAGLPDYKDLFPLEMNATEERQNAGLNRNRCARAADSEVVSFFDVDDYMHPRRLELLSLEFGNYHPKAVVHAYEETPKYTCDSKVDSFKNRNFGNSFQIFDGIGIYDLSMTPDADAKNSLRTPNNHGLNHAGHISVLRSVFSEVQQSNLARGQDAKFARDILKHFGRHEDTMACLDVPLTLYCHQGNIHWFGFAQTNDTTKKAAR